MLKTKPEVVADFLDHGDPMAAGTFCRQNDISLPEWHAGLALSEQRRQEHVAAELQAVGEKYEVRYREGSSGWYQWIRTYHLPYAQGQFEALRLRGVVTEARLTQGSVILDSFSRELVGPTESAMRGEAA